MRVALAGVVVGTVVVVLAGFGYEALASPGGSADVTGLTCRWAGSHMVASGTLVNHGDFGRFDVSVSYALAIHGRQRQMSATIPVDADAAKAFSWGEGDYRFVGERVTACSSSVQRNTAHGD